MLNAPAAVSVSGPHLRDSSYEVVVIIQAGPLPRGFWQRRDGVVCISREGSKEGEARQMAGAGKTKRGAALRGDKT